jgi:hypothetical protein
MSAQQEQPPVAPPPATQGAGASTGQPGDTALLDALIARGLSGANPAQLQASGSLEGYPQMPNPDPNSAPPLYGEPPGLGYLYAHDPEFRQLALVSTTPEIVRKMILRSMEVVATNTLLPFNEEGAAKNADAMLKMAQAYLLIDPAVDAEGVPVAGKQTAMAGAQIAVNASKPQPTGGGNPGGGKSIGKPQSASSSGEAHGDVKKGPTVAGHAEPPRVVAGRAAQILQQMHQNAEDVLKGARGSRPLPRPRPSS